MPSILIENPYAKKQKAASVNRISPTEKIADAAPPLPSSFRKQPEAHAPPAAPSAAALVISACDKAGMEGIDRTRIDAIILRESGDSLFMQQQRRRDVKVDERIQQLQKKLSNETKNDPDWKSKMEREIDYEFHDIIAKRPERSCSVVVDMDMFYMACELLARPELKNQPACVGGNMITTSNYVARKYGVRSAMAGWIGDKLVEELSGGQERLVHVPLNFDLYTAKSMLVRKVLAEYDPGLRAYSLDEVYLDLAPYLACKLIHDWDHERIRDALMLADLSQVELDDDDEGGDYVPTNYGYEQLLQFPDSRCREVIAGVIRDMRNRVREATGGLTCSAGAAPNFMLAKIASDRNKPDGQLIIGSGEEEVKSFLHPLPPRKVGGIGRVTDKILHAFGITTIAELYEQRALVRLLFQSASASSLLHASIGCSSSDEKAISEDEDSPCQKGISRERTFRAGKPWDDVIAWLHDIGRLLSADMTRKNLWARNICIKVKLHTFDCLSRSKTLPVGVFLRESEDINQYASELLHEIRRNHTGKTFSVRLLGIRCTSLLTDDEKRFNTAGLSIQSFFQMSPHSDISVPSRCSSPIPTDGIESGLHTGTCRSSVTRVLAHERKQMNIVACFLQNDNVNRLKGGLEKSAESNTLRAQKSAVVGKDVSVLCPLCEKAFAVTENEALNRHIDFCLNGESVRQAVRDAGAAGDASTAHKRQRKTLLDAFLSGRHMKESNGG
ncbi:hypothetical protein MPSEU_000370500 [Mayamaea pseudoterrestris]|nr:hypothetical protein MPSEU_000370500 [Mayamaea pseudoterrestris]